MRYGLLVMFVLALMYGNIANAKTLFVKDYGLNTALNGEERFEVLRKAHVDAVRSGATISYKGISQLEIEIPKDAKSIPLPPNTCFENLRLSVKNTKVHNFTLFTLSQELKRVEVSKEQITLGRYDDIKELAKGERLLIIEDETPWVINRLGYNYGATRKDIVYLKNGKAQGTLIASYNNDISSPKCMYCDVKKKCIKINNLVFIRTIDSEKITKLLCIYNQNGVIIENITINTPESNLYGDRAIDIQNVTNLKMNNVTINGTYSQSRKYGYGISLYNVWNAKFSMLNAHGNWGIFGNNNVNSVVIEDSDINRFDIHCYGRDVLIKKTVFRNLYNQFSSFYGTLEFRDCKFVNFTPVLFESSYSAYTPFDIKVKDCKWIISKNDKPYFIKAGDGLARPNARAELRDVYWPDIYIENMDVIIDVDLKELYLYYLDGQECSNILGAEYILLNKVTINSSKKINPTFHFTNNEVKSPVMRTIKIRKSSFNTIQ